MTTAVGEGRYLAVTEHDLCERAGVSPAELAVHAGSVEGCLVRAFDQGMDALYDRAAQAFECPGSWERRLRAAMQAVVDELNRRAGLARLCYVDGLELGGIEVWRRRERARERFVELVSHDDDEESPRLRFELIVGALYMALRRHALAGGGWSDIEGLAGALVEQALVFEPLAA